MARSLAAYARKQTDNGRALVDFMLDVMLGKPLPLHATRDKRSRARYPQTPKVEHRLVAAQWLADRGWGKAKELIELQGDVATTPEQRLAILRRLSDDERAQLRTLLAKALATPPVSDASAEPVAPVDLEPAGDLEAAHLETLGRPRNVGRALAPELEDDEHAADSPADPPADLDNPAPA